MKKIAAEIVRVLDEHPAGLKGSEIANILNVSKQSVNHFLAFDQTDFVQKSDYRWIRKSMGNSSCFSDPILSKLKNQEGARTFTLQYFNSLADWSYCKSVAPRKLNRKTKKPTLYKTKFGNIIECDSKYEITMLEYLEQQNLVQAIGAQNIDIGHSTAFKNDKSYHPDFIVLTNEGYIALIEIKAFTAMSHHTSIEKYHALKEYCEKNGFMYMMVDPKRNFFTYDDFYAVELPNDLFNHIMWYLQNVLTAESECLLEQSDVPILYEEVKNDYTLSDLQFYLHALIVQKGWYNKSTYGFNVFKYPTN